MKVYDMFQKKIDRQITGVIKVGQDSEAEKKQELEEYVVTRELTKHFRTFFANYSRSIDTPTDEMGAWISGFFGSGKSHFLKILSYILGNEVVDGKNVIEYFRDKENLTSDPMIFANMEKAAHTPTKAILFNVDSKSASSAKSNSNAIVAVFNRVFNEKMGYDGANPALADLERALDEEGNYQKFKDTFRELNGKEWVEERNKFRVIRGKVAKTLAAMGRMTEEEAMEWTKVASTMSYEIAITDFADRVQKYIEKTGNRVVFLVDEIGQFISNDSNLMLNLQTVTEELGTHCHGKAWVVVTAQEDLDSMTESMAPDLEQETDKTKKNDFSKIQGRFKTRLSLTSVNADEVIRERILKKNAHGEATLKSLYESNETRIQNAVVFKGNGYELQKYHSAQEFSDVYPFLPYQFHLLADVLNSIRLNSASGRNLSEGERSMLGAFQEAAKHVENEEDGVLIPFYRFYDDLLKFVDHTHVIVIERAEDSERINPLHEEDCFNVNVLKTLFLLKYIDGIPMTVDNIMNFMVTSINEDKTELRKKVEEALRLLTNSLLVSQIQDTYEFLTDEEQDINRAIRDRDIQQADVRKAISNIVFSSIYDATRYRVPKFNGRYTFAYNQFVDSQPVKGTQNNQITLRIVTPRYVGSGTVIGTDDNSMAILSANREVILRLPNDSMLYYREITNALKIEDYLRNVADPQKGKSTVIRSTKVQEAAKSREAALAALKDAIGDADVFINSNKVTDIGTHDPVSKINEAMGRLVESVFYKLSYIDAPMDDSDIRNLFKGNEEVRLDLGDGYGSIPNHLAVNEVKDYLDNTTSAHSMISMKGVVDSFSRDPYGYIDSDTKWLLAKLFYDGEISATVDKVPFSKFNTERETLISYFTSKKYDEKILFRKKAMIEQKKLNSAKKVMKDLFNHTEISTDPDKIMEIFKHSSGELLNSVQEMLKQQKLVPQYPGKETLESAAKKLSCVSTLNGTITFFDWTDENKVDLLEMAEDLAPVKTFYQSEYMQTIFKDNGIKAIDLYENSKEHITDTEITRVIAQIKAIITSKMPYEQIKDLPVLYKKFTDIYGRILDEKLAPVLEIINADEQTVLNALAGKKYENDYKSKVVSNFQDLRDRAGRQNDISDLLGFKDKAESRMKTYLDAFEKLDQAPKTTPGTGKEGTNGQGIGEGGASPKPARKIRHLTVTDITSRTWVVKDEASLNQYLDQIRNAIEQELNADTDVYIHF